MEQGEIDADLGRFRGHVMDLIEEIRLLVHTALGQRTLQIEAHVAHLRMVQAYEFSVDESLPLEVRTFYAALGAERITQDACSVALERGAIATLTAQMEAISLREGCSDETWIPGEGPQNYQHLAGKRSDLLKNIEQMMMVYVRGAVIFIRWPVIPVHWRQILVRGAQFGSHRQTTITRGSTTDLPLTHKDNPPGFREYLASAQAS